MIKISTKKYYTVREAAETLGKAPFTIRKYCREGKIPCVRVHSTALWMIPAEFVEAVTNNEQGESGR